MYFSNSTKGFYPAGMLGDYEAAGSFPVDAKSIDLATESTLRASIQSGDTITVDASGFVITPKPPTPLVDVQSAAYESIDYQAGITRKKYITDVAGQSETYLLKANDAQAYKAAAYPSASIASYPMVQAEAIALYGATPTAAQFQSAADYIINTQGQWLQMAAKIEQQRRAGKISVGAATTNAGVASAEQAALAALAAL
ncbi:MAG: hypothetical protein ACXWAT_00960 [Methylobacter sp.]